MWLAYVHDLANDTQIALQLPPPGPVSSSPICGAITCPFALHLVTLIDQFSLSAG